MSKRREQYEQGLERLLKYLELFHGEKTVPTLREIQAEIKAIPAFRATPVNIKMPNPPLNPSDDFLALVGEQYERYDDPVPQTMTLHILGVEIDDPKLIDQRASKDVM